MSQRTYTIPGSGGNTLGWKTAESFENTRTVWSLITKHPHASLRELSEMAGLSHVGAKYHIRRLVAAGYIEVAGGKRGRARRVIVPCGVSSEF